MKIILTVIIAVIGVGIGWNLAMNQLRIFNEKELEIYVDTGELPERKNMLKKQLMYILGLVLCSVALTYLY